MYWRAAHGVVEVLATFPALCYLASEEEPSLGDFADELTAASAPAFLVKSHKRGVGA